MECIFSVQRRTWADPRVDDWPNSTRWFVLFHTLFRYESVSGPSPFPQLKLLGLTVGTELGRRNPENPRAPRLVAEPADVKFEGKGSGGSVNRRPKGGEPKSWLSHSKASPDLDPVLPAQSTQRNRG